MTTLEEISALTRPRHPDDWTEIDSAAVDTIRVLAADAVQKVGNGHPGTAMSLAPLAYTLFQRTMRHDPSDTHWLGRDRFVLSAGHSSLTLYIQLYLGGFGLELSDIESLRTWGSKTPDTRSSATPPALRSPPARWGRDWRRRSGWRWPRATSAACSTRTPNRAPAPSTTTSMSSPPTVTSKKRVTSESVVAGRGPATGQPHRVLRPQPDLDRGRHQHRAV